MKKVLVFLIISLFVSQAAYSATVGTRVSANTITFSTSAAAVTFNSVTNKVILRNDSPAFDVYVDVKGVDTNGKQRDANATTHPYTAAILIPSASTTPNIVILDIATRNLGFISNDGSGSITYIVTGEVGDL